jgi:hypothetical protein
VGAVHPFPIKAPPPIHTIPAKEPALPPKAAPPSPVLEAIDSIRTRNLHDTVSYVIDSGRVLVDFVDQDRYSARMAGVETIALELAGMIDSGRLDSIKDHLEEVSLGGGESKISLDGLAYLKRAEKLLADATTGLQRVTGGTRAAFLGQADGGPSGYLILGVVALAGIAAIAIVSIVTKSKR